MITLYEGFPGSGKTYDSVRKIVSNLQKGRRVVTNIDGLDSEHHQEALKHLTNIDDKKMTELLIKLDRDQTQQFWLHTKVGDLIVIDEAQNFFNSRDWQKQSNRDFGVWASEHRHNVQDLVLITQNATRIDSAVRGLIEWTYRYKKLNMFGSLVSKKYVRFAYYGSDTQVLSKKVCTYDKPYFHCYSSYFADGGKELDVEKKPNMFKHPIFYLIPIVLIALFYTMSKSSLITGDLFGVNKISAKKSVMKEGVVITDEKNTIKENKNIIKENKNIEENKFEKFAVVNGKKYYFNAGGVHVK